jgi:hypothetical protein
MLDFARVASCSSSGKMRALLLNARVICRVASVSYLTHAASYSRCVPIFGSVVVPVAVAVSVYSVFTVSQDELSHDLLALIVLHRSKNHTNLNTQPLV